MTLATTPSLNLVPRQTMLCFAYLAYTGETLITGNPGPSMLSNLQAALQAIQTPVNLSTWSVVWGPVAYTVPGSLYQDNMMFVVQNAGTSDYAIAVRGTNFASQVDWFLEDFEVINTLPWPMPGATSNCPPGTAISESASIDMHVLLGPGMSDPAKGQLLPFLQSLASTGHPINLCVTGHSLGGMLSSTLALYLLENQPAWDASLQSTVSCIGFAAPSAGNALFAANANSVFAKAAQQGSFTGWDASLGTNLDNVACNLDAAPLFYTGSNIASGGKAGPLFSIYADVLDFSKLHALASNEWGYFQSMVLQPLADLMSTQGYTPLQTQFFEGSFVGDSIRFPELSSIGAYLSAFVAQAAYQHSCSYPVYLNVPAVLDPSIVVRGGAAPIPPKLDAITPAKGSTLDLLGLSVVITGSGFVAGSAYANHLVFTGSDNPVGYTITEATATQIQATFYPRWVTPGEQGVTVVTSSPYCTSNSLSFDVTL